MPDPIFVPAQPAGAGDAPVELEPAPYAVAPVYSDEVHAILGGMLGIMRALVAVTPGAGNQTEAAVEALLARVAGLKPPLAAITSTDPYGPG